MSEPVETLLRTIDVTKFEITEAEIVNKSTTQLLGDLEIFISEVEKKSVGLDDAGKFTVCQEAFASLRGWAKSEMLRVQLRPELLRERERTLVSVVEFLKLKSSEVTETQIT